MSKRLTAAALAAVLALGMTGCSSGNNYSRGADRYFGTDTYPAENYVTGENYYDETDSRYREMLDNGRVRDTDGYLLDGEDFRG